MQEKRKRGRGLSLVSGGLDSRLAVCVLKEQGLEVEGVVFASPFFKIQSAIEAAEQLKIKLHIIDFTAAILDLLKKPKHGFGGAMNPCIDCHARMIKRAGEMMVAGGYDFVATGEVLGQRPMSQNQKSLGIVEQDSELGGRLLRPLCAKLLEPTLPEQEGVVDRSRLLALSGRSRKPQLQLAKEKYKLDKWPSPAGGCLLTESGFANRLREEAKHEGLDDIFSVKLLLHGRHFRLSDNSRLVIGRNAQDNQSIADMRRPQDVLLDPQNVPGPVGLLTGDCSEETLQLALQIVAAYSDHPAEGKTEISVLSGDGSSRILQAEAKTKEEFQRWMIGLA